MHYDKKKEYPPEQTVLKIQNILKKIGIEQLEEMTLSRLVDDDCAVSTRLCLSEDYFCGTNGKGTSLEYARASAYAEFMERIQYPYILEYLPPDNRKISNREFKKLEIFKYFLPKEKINNKKYIDEIIDISSDFAKYKFGRYIDTVPYNYINKNKIVYLPQKLRWYVAISTGTSAGNTDYEALVEGLSEIFERFIQTKAIVENITFPDIPEEIYMKYDSIKKLVQYVKKLGFKILVKDASLNGKYPVICTVIINEYEKSYFAAFGAHPYLPLAIERCFTETLQGIDLSNERIIDFYFKTEGKKDNSIKCAKVDNALSHRFIELNKSFFLGESDYSFNLSNWQNVENMSNKELFQSIIYSLTKNNIDVFIRDVSFLNFPAFQIYIPQLMSNYINIDDEKGLSLRYHYTKCDTVIKNNLNITLTKKEMLDFFNYFFHMRMRYSTGDYKNIELYYLILLIQVKNYDKAINILRTMLNMKNFIMKKRLISFFIDYIEFIKINTKTTEIKNSLAVRYGRYYTNKIFDLFISKKGYSNLIKMMKKRKLNEINKEGIARKNEIIESLLNEYRKNIPNQLSLKKLVSD